MFVQEEKIFAGKVLKIHVCTMDGTEWLEEVTEDTTVEKLKEKCLKHCVHGSIEDPKTLTHHKLIHAATERVLTDTKTVADENLKDKDVLLLIKKRPPPTLPKIADVATEEKKKQDNKAPDKDAILKATANLSTRHSDRTVTQHNIRDFQTELRKILVSLIEVAQKLLALNPDAVELFKKANAMLDEDEEDRVDETALQQLTEMGFPESRAIKALRLNHMSVTQAMEWLIEHVDDPSVDTPLPAQDPSGASGATSGASGATSGASGAASGPSGAASGPSGATSGASGAASGPSGAASGPSGATSGASGAASGASGAASGASGAASGASGAASGASGAASGASGAASGASGAVATATPGPSVSASASGPNLVRSLSQSSSEESTRQDELTEIFKRIRRKREFRPDSRAVIALMEMGFDEKEVIDALRVNNNQQDAACEWLLGDRKPSPDDLDKGIDTNSPLFQAILENPVVQLGLTNPKTLLAFEDMLENPLNSTQWMNDPETGPVMLQISRIFQTLNRT